MGKKAWIVFGFVCVIVIAVALVLMLVLVPQVKGNGTLAGNYEELAKQDYTFSAEQIRELKQEYKVTQSDVNSGKKTDKFDDGNINPFTPQNEVTIYNEPTLQYENGSGELTPDRK